MRLLLLNTGPVATLASGDINSPLMGTDMSDTESLVLDGQNGILMDGDKSKHTIEKCYEVTSKTLDIVFDELTKDNIFIALNLNTNTL